MGVGRGMLAQRATGESYPEPMSACDPEGHLGHVLQGRVSVGSRPPEWVWRQQHHGAAELNS